MKIYNEKKICFIICANDNLQLQECLLYLSLLQIPEGYEVEVLTITEAKSMASGYNEGMNSSDAKYKIYIHQDTFIIDHFFLKKLLHIFKRDKKIGMIGMVGAEKISKDGVMWHEDRCGNFYRLEEFIEGGFANISILKRGCKEVEVIDGFFMATQYDLPWREDILQGWDFYDVSQCMEFRRAGYRIVVPAQRPLWVIHACGTPSFWDYEKNRKIVLKEYPEIADSQPGRLRILFLHSEQIVLIGIVYSLVELGHHVDIGQVKVSLAGNWEKDVEPVEELLEEGHYDLVVTYDFGQGVSVACNNMGVKYYSWIYDSPFMGLYTKEALNPVNYFSVFDRKQYERLQVRKFEHMMYLPLASEVEMFGSVSIKKRDEKKYKADVSFLGRLYDNKGYKCVFDDSNHVCYKEAEQLVCSLGCKWDCHSELFGKASDELIDYILSKLTDDYWKIWDIDKRFYCETLILGRRCNEIERVAILNKLAEKFNVVLYSDESSKEMLKNVEIRPWADYGQVMPKVFYLSKINLNITSRNIESGIPQRVWDIMSVGGFCLTNYQPELEEHFVIGEDLEVYYDLDELVRKVDYYLNHEEERTRIAINGYKKVRKYHDYKLRMEKILKFIFPDKTPEGGKA